MNLQQAVSMQDLQTPASTTQPRRKMSAQAMAERVFQIAAQGGHPFENITAAQWAEKWLDSPEFVLTDVETDRIALLRTPRNTNLVLRNMQAQSDSLEPVVVDMNKQGLTIKSGYTPPMIAVDGAHRCYGQYLIGRERIRAWVGVKALERMTASAAPASIQASAVKKFATVAAGTKISSDAILHAAQGLPQPPRQDTGDGGPSPTSTLPTAHAGVPGGSEFIRNRGVTKKKKMDSEGFGPSGAGRFPGGGGGHHGPSGGGGFGGTMPRPVASAPHPVSLKSGKAHKAGCMCAECKKKMSATGGGAGGGAASGSTGGPGGATSGANPANPYSISSKKKVAASRRTPEAISTGELEQPDPSDEKVPPDPSDAGQSTSPSDRLQYKQQKQTKPPGVRQNANEIRNKTNPNWQSPGSGVGPRLTPDKGASKSEMQRTLAAKKDCVDCGTMDAGPIKVKKMVTKKKKKNMAFVAPPGRESQVKELKKKYGKDSPIPFKIAWSQHGKKSKTRR